MERQSSKKHHRPAEPLVSRHIFLDTQVYRALGHNPVNRVMTLLKEQVTSHRVVLHTTDITLAEVRRQIRESVFARQRELGAIEKDIARWRKSAPKAATEDKAMTRAVSADERLLALKGIHKVLARAAADLGADGEAAAEAVLSKPAFDSSLEAALRAQMKEVGYVYVGDLAEGEAYEGKLLGPRKSPKPAVATSWNVGCLSQIVNGRDPWRLMVAVLVRPSAIDHVLIVIST
jgi:hypothetical protein